MEQCSNFYITVSFTIPNSVLYFEEITKCILLFRFGFLQNINELNRTSVHNWSFWSIQLNKYVVDLKSNQCSQCVFDRADTSSTLFNRCSARHVYNAVAIGINDGRTR